MRAQRPTVTSGASPMAPVASAGSASTWSISSKTRLVSEHDSENADSAIRFYGRRKGKPLKAARQGLLETLLPHVRVARPDHVIDPASLFSFTPASVRLEIGFGAGEHLAAQASANPDIGFIGSEVFLNGVASLLRYIDAGK